MTYAFALKYRGSAYLFADSVTTQYAEVPPDTKTTSFGEASLMERGKTVQEGCLKILRIADDCYVAFSGVVHLAEAAAGILQQAYREGIPTSDLLRALAINFGYRPADKLDLLLARNSGGVPEIWHWRAADPSNPVSVELGAQIGSLPGTHAVTVDSQTLALSFMANNLTEEELLVSMTACIQSFGLRDWLLQNGVGGAIVSVRLAGNGAQWLPDTNYIVHDKDMQNPDVVSIAVRRDGVFIKTTYSQWMRTFASGTVHGPQAEALVELESEMLAHFARSAARFWIFLGSYAMTIFVLDAGAVVSETPVMRHVKTGHSERHYQVSSLLRDELAVPPPAGMRPFPIRLAYQTSESALRYLALRAYERANGIELSPLRFADPTGERGAIRPPPLTAPERG